MCLSWGKVCDQGDCVADLGAKEILLKDQNKVASEQSHSDAVAQHYNQLQETGLDARAQSRIFYLRNFNNWIKSMLIADTLQKLRSEGHPRRDISVLDLCSGKGGDLRKWEKGRIKKLICADIAQTSVEQAKDRYIELVQRNNSNRYPQNLFSAEFIAADCSKVRLKDVYPDPLTQFDLVSCQFSFHYCFESYQQADIMLRNACECLCPGGYFIGTTPNAQEIMRRLKDSNSNTFGNDVYSVTFEGASPDSFRPPLFGARYNFHLEGVVDCPEFLVYFPLLEKMAEKHGMKLVYKKPFSDFFETFKEEGEGRSLLGKMQALEPFPASEDVRLMGEEEQYSHARQMLSDLEASDQGAEGNPRRHPQKLGTLSQSEWEAISLYLVFVFQKHVDVSSDEAAAEG
ncbi:mRNA cap guanine-N7 methyltransferase-like [Liolophura sinensis]|uniref:mRNA cap guanine-N7 methyltransferase-like n=1 Tax=Liolophura sinensis TaxID=3198878 RepID=UPI003159258B